MGGGVKKWVETLGKGKIPISESFNFGFRYPLAYSQSQRESSVESDECKCSTTQNAEMSSRNSINSDDCEISHSVISTSFENLYFSK